MKDNYKRIFLLCLFIIVACISLQQFPGDDVLRHVGVAFSKVSSWGDVYPFSRFEEFRTYNPWYGYDLILRGLAKAVLKIPLPVLTLKFLMIKFLSVLFLLSFCWIVLTRSDMFDAIKDRQTFTLGLALFLSFLTIPLLRVTLARPFVFGTLYLVYSSGQRGFIRGILSSLALTFLYPYLSWFYVLPVSFAHYIKGDKKFAAGAVLFMIAFLLCQPLSFWGFQIALFESDGLRSVINEKITEFYTSLSFWGFFAFIIGYLIFYPGIKKKKLSYQNLLILIYLVPACKYVRYFIDIALPLLFLAFIKDLIILSETPSRKLIEAWKKILEQWLSEIILFLKSKVPKLILLKISFASQPAINLKPYIAVAFLALFALLFYGNYRQFYSLKDFADGLNPIPNHSQVLSGFNLQYKTILVRPDLKLIPSCEMGFPRNDLSKEYIDYLNSGIISPIARKTGAKYLLDNNNHYIDPGEGEKLKLLNKCAYFTLWEIQPKRKMLTLTKTYQKTMSIWGNMKTSQGVRHKLE